jgi:calmodulin
MSQSSKHDEKRDGAGLSPLEPFDVTTAPPSLAVSGFPEPSLAASGAASGTASAAICQTPLVESPNMGAMSPNMKQRVQNVKFGEAHDHSHSTMAELSEAYRMLMGSGAIGYKELGAQMRSHGLHPTDDDVKDIIRAFNQQQDGHVNYPEFAALMTRAVDVNDVDSMRAAFASADKDGRGWVTISQFTELFATCGEKSSPEEVEEMLRFADPNKSGKVDYGLFLSTLAYRLQ